LAVTVGGRERVRAEPFEAIALELGALWPEDAIEGDESKG
jgi:hypothetical protein